MTLLPFFPPPQCIWDCQPCLSQQKCISVKSNSFMYSMGTWLFLGLFCFLSLSYCNGIINLCPRCISSTLRNNWQYVTFPLNFNCHWHFLRKEMRLVGRVLCCQKSSVLDLRSTIAWEIWLECQFFFTVTVWQHLSFVTRISIFYILRLTFSFKAQSLTAQDHLSSFFHPLRPILLIFRTQIFWSFNHIWLSRNWLL